MDVANPSSLGDRWIQRTDPQFLILVRKQIIINNNHNITNDDNHKPKAAVWK